MKEKDVRYIIVDVDGTLTDGGIYYGCNREEIKRFNVKDGIGFQMARMANISIVLLTGRKSEAVERRAEELGVKYVFQGINDKKKFLMDFMEDYNISKEQIAYIGDDINDYSAMKKCASFVACPKDASVEIKEISDYISDRSGGDGAFRDTVEFILKQRNQYCEIIESFG